MYYWVWENEFEQRRLFSFFQRSKFEGLFLSYCCLFSGPVWYVRTLRQWHT